MVRWLWQAYLSDLATVVGGLPYERPLPSTACRPATRSGCRGVRGVAPTPEPGEDSPVAFALVQGVEGDVRSGTFWVAPAARRGRIGHHLALEIIDRHPPPWTITFRHDNTAAGAFWRRVATSAFGTDRWTEERLPVPDRPHAPPDHWIRSR